MPRYVGTYCGIVRENNDPLRMGRVKVHVPTVMGIASDQSEQMSVDQLPWALKAGMPSGATPDSGGIDWLPEIGDQVWVRFLDGEPEKPIWEWATQTIQQAKDFKLHDYDLEGRPQRAGITRYGHTIDLTSDTLIVTTKNGYAFQVTDSDEKKGVVQVVTPSGHTVTLSDLENLIELTTASGQAIQLDDATNAVRVVVNEDLDVDVGQEAYVAAAKVTVRALSGQISLTSLAGITLQSGPSTLKITPGGFDFTGT